MTKASNLSVPRPDTKTPQNQQVGDVQPRPWHLITNSNPTKQLAPQTRPQPSTP